MLKIKTLLIAVFLLFLSSLNILGASAANTASDTSLSPGLTVIAYENPLITSGIAGNPIYFEAADFATLLGYIPSSVTILTLPPEENGILMHGTTPVNIGDSVSVLTLSSLYYKPTSTDDAEFTFSTDNTSPLRCIIRSRENENLAPVSAISANAEFQTGKNLALTSHLPGSDPDGDSVRFEITTYPKRGLLSLNDPSTGEFTYSPYSGMHGQDTFSYRIIDKYGAVSPDYTANVTIDKKSGTLCGDMLDRGTAYAAGVMIDTGAMTAASENGENVFSPDAAVSRIDFLQMLMTVAGAENVPSADNTAFCDTDELSAEQKGYLQCAYKLGIVQPSLNNGLLSFSPNEPITGGAAAVMINKILGLSEDEALSVMLSTDDVPTWALPALSALTAAGICDRYTAPANAELTREDCAVLLSRLYVKLEK